MLAVVDLTVDQAGTARGNRTEYQVTIPIARVSSVSTGADWGVFFGTVITQL